MDAWHRTYELPVTVLRPFNTYGPHQSARAIVPTIISQALAGDTLRLGSLHPRRDMTFVTDTVAGFLAAATSPAAVGQTVQLGTGSDVSIADIVREVGAILGRELHTTVDDSRIRPPASEVERLISSPARAGELMGWAPQVSLGDGLRETIEWLRGNTHRYRAGEYAI